MTTELHRILTVFEDTTRSSALPIVLGAKPFREGRVWATSDGVLRLDRGDTQLRLFDTRDGRILRGHSRRRLVAVEGRYERRSDGSWFESESLVFEYPTLEALETRAMPERRLSTVLRPDGSVLTTTIERTLCPVEDEELLARKTCLMQRDRSRVEEEESILRVQERARYDLYRREFDPRYRTQKSLEYRYPWLPHAFYEKIWNALVDFAMSTDAWAAAM